MADNHKVKIMCSTGIGDHIELSAYGGTDKDLVVRAHDGDQTTVTYLNPDGARELFNTLGVWLHTGKLP